MRTEITPGQTSDYLGFDLVMADNLPSPRVLLADRGYDADSIRAKMEERGVLPVIQIRKSPTQRIGVGRPPSRLRELHQRVLRKLNQDRHLARRYAKRAKRIRGVLSFQALPRCARHV